MKKDNTEEIKEAGFFSPKTRGDFCVPSRKKYKFSEVFDRPVFSEKLAVWEITKEKNSQIRMDVRGNPR